MAVNSSNDVLQDELSCCVCLDLFENPITLPCDHSLCEKCLEQVRTDTALGKKMDVIKCPLCRRSADVCTNPLVKNLILERIVRVYKEDRESRLKRTQSCNLNEIQRSTNTGNKADVRRTATLPIASQFQPQLRRPKSMALVLPIQETALFCNPYDPGSTDNKPLRPSGSVLDLRLELNSSGDGDCLTKCTAGCSNPSAKAVILCTQCKNQYCRLCWEHHPSLDGEDSRDHTQRLHVYVTAFLDDINVGNCRPIECNNCDPEFHEPATLICFHCNVNFCETCYKRRHPALVINHYVVKKPDVLPTPPQRCTFCTKHPSNMAKLCCKVCKKNFCNNCFMDAIHGCVKEEVGKTESTDQGISTERQIQREMVNLMHLKKQLVQEIPLFFSKKNQLKKPKPDLKVGDRVVSYPEAQNVELRGVVKWIGQLPDANDDNVTVGVEFDDAVGGGDGTYNGTRLFESKNGHTGFVSILNVIREIDVAPARYDNANVGVDDTTVNTDILPIVCDIEEDMVSDNLLIGDRVAYFQNDSFVKGTVKWIGCLPDDTTGATSVGVEFDSPIGSGTGKYKDHRLFYAKQNHASLLPILGLIKVEDL